MDTKGMDARYEDPKTGKQYRVVDGKSIEIPGYKNPAEERNDLAPGGDSSDGSGE